MKLWDDEQTLCRHIQVRGNHFLLNADFVASAPLYSVIRSADKLTICLPCSGNFGAASLEDNPQRNSSRLLNVRAASEVLVHELSTQELREVDTIHSSS